MPPAAKKRVAYGPRRAIESSARLTSAQKRAAGLTGTTQGWRLLTLVCGHNVLRIYSPTATSARCGHCAQDDAERAVLDAERRRLGRGTQDVVTKPSARLRKQREQYERARVMAIDEKAEEYLGARVRGLARDYDTILEQLTLGLDPDQLEEGDRFGLDFAMLAFPVIYQPNGNVRFAAPAPGHTSPPAMLQHPAMQGGPAQAGGLVRMYEAAFAGFLAQLTARFPEQFGLPPRDASAD